MVVAGLVLAAFSAVQVGTSTGLGLALVAVGLAASAAGCVAWYRQRRLGRWDLRRLFDDSGGPQEPELETPGDDADVYCSACDVAFDPRLHRCPECGRPCN